MDIRINIKDCECDHPSVVTKNALSEVEHKKKNMLYAPPEQDGSNSTKPKLNSGKNSQNRRNSQQGRQNAQQTNTATTQN